MALRKIPPMCGCGCRQRIDLRNCVEFRGKKFIPEHEKKRPRVEDEIRGERIPRSIAICGKTSNTTGESSTMDRQSPERILGI